MSTFKHFDEATGKWIIDAAGNAHNIELDNELLQDENGKSISVARGFQKVNNKISKLEHHLAWIYQNGAKGGGGGGGTGGGSGVYTITVNSDRKVFYTSTNSITINITINSGSQKKTFFVNAMNMANGAYLVAGEQHQSMIPFDFTIPNLPGSSNQIYLQAYDSADNYTELVEITVNVGSVSIVRRSSPGASYTLGGNNITTSSFDILNKTGATSYLLTYRSRSNTPLKDALADGASEMNKFGAVYMTPVPSTSSSSVYIVDYDAILSTLQAGTTATFKTVLYTPSLDYASDYFTDQITITSGDALIAIMYNLGETAEEGSQYLFEENNYCTFDILLYYEKTDIRTFFYRYNVYNSDTLVYQSDTYELQASTFGSTSINCPTTNFEIGNNYRIEFEACATNDFSHIPANKYSTAVGFFGIKAGSQGMLYDYKGALLARFGSFNFPGDRVTKWDYTIPSDEKSDYHFTAWPASIGKTTSLRVHNATNTTGLSSNTYRYMNLSGNTYATIDRFAELFPNNVNIQNSLMAPGFFMQVTYEYTNNDPVNQCILSFGDYRNGSLYRGFEINSDYIKLAFGTVTGFLIDTPTVPENAYPLNSDKKTRTTTVGLNVWSTTLKTANNTTQQTYYFALYIDGVMTKCALIPANVLSSESSGWLFGTPLYLGCRSDLTNQANCNIYDFKLYAQNQPDLSIVWNYMSAVEQAHLIKDSTGAITVDEALDNNLRNKNLFNKSSNSCLLCGDDGNYLDAAAMYSRITTLYENYDLDYPVVYIQETAQSSDMYQCIKATWRPEDRLNDVLITKKTWDVNIIITTKYGQVMLTSDGYDEINGSHSPKVAIQGTSSLSYNGKNLEAYCGYTDDNKERLLKVNGWLPENEFTLKADVVDSAHVNNVAIGKFINESGYMPHYEGAGYSSSDNIGKKIKNTSEGFPCLVFIKYSDGSVDEAVNTTIAEDGSETRIGKTEFLGVYNFNLGRYAYHNLGLRKLKSYVQDNSKNDDAPQIIDEYETETPENVYSMEISDNFGNEEELFTQADTTITEYTTECRYTATTEENATKAITDTLYNTLARSDGSNTSGYEKKYRTADGQYMPILDNGVVQYWTNDSTSTMEATIENNLSFEVLRKYLILALVFGMVDSTCKNMVFRSWNGIKWYPAFYDMDSAFKLDNGAADSITYDAHIHRFFNGGSIYTDALDSFTQGVNLFPSPNAGYDDWRYQFAGVCSKDGEPNRIWKMLQQCDARIINISDTAQAATTPGQYWILRNTFIKDPDKFIDEYFSGYINKTGAIMYNLDYRQKYVSYNQKWVDGVGLVSDTSAAQTQFLYGTRVSAVRSWFKKRINFLDSVYASYSKGSTASGSYISDSWNSRQTASSTSIQFAIKADQRCKIGFSVSSEKDLRYIWVDETLRTYTVQVQNQGNLFYLYGGSIITEMPDFYKMGWTNITAPLNFKLLQSLNMQNNEVSAFTGADTINGLPNVTKIDLGGFKFTGSSSLTLGLAECNSLKELYLNNECNIASFTLPSTGTLQVLDLSNNSNISSIPTQNVNGTTQSCLIGQSGLKIVNLEGTSITDLSGNQYGLINMPSLETLTIPDTLAKLTISNCGLKSLTKTWTSTDTPSPLTDVNITECPELEEINLSGQTSLKNLNINNCPKLKRIILSNTSIAENVTINFETLSELEVLDITNTTLFTDLDLRSCKHLSSIAAQGCSNLTRVRCSYDEEDPIELQANAFNGCSGLTTLTGNFLLQGASIFEGCTNLEFDNLFDTGVLNISFDKISNFSKVFKGCSKLGNDGNWPMKLIHKLNEAVGNISEMFEGTASNFGINENLFCYEEDGELKNLNVTDISGIFQNTQIWGRMYSETEDGVGGLFSHMPVLLTAERAFAYSTATRYIDNNFFHWSNAKNITNVDYMFQGNVNIVSVEDSHANPLVETPLHSKDFFIELIKCKHTEERTSGQTSVPNPDWPYPFGIFGNTGIKMIVDLNEENKPFLFHVADSSIVQKNIYLENNLYSGIHLILEDCDYSYLFGGGKKNGVVVDKTISDGENTYYIPKFVRVSSPFTESEDLHIDLTKIDGDIFFDGTMKYLTMPFSGMVLNNVTTIPDDIFSGANTVISLNGFFANLGLDNEDIGVYDFAEHDIFKDCEKLQDIASIFKGCNKFKMRLAPRMFRNCSLIDVTSAFEDSRVIEQLPSELFYMEKDGEIKATITQMGNVFNMCYNLGYKSNYRYAEVPVKLDGTTTTWYDHVVENPSSQLEGYSVPEDLFWYCKRNANIANVLGQMFWQETGIPEEAEDGLYPVFLKANSYIGPVCKIPVNIFRGGYDFKYSDKIEYGLANTRFKPEGTIDPNTLQRGYQYPDGLFLGMVNLANITGMFKGTEISPYCMINPDLFRVDTQGNNCPLENISYVWAECKFTYKATEREDDLGSPQLVFNMFDALPELTDASYLFLGNNEQGYGLRKIDISMFDGIEQAGTLKSLNISGMFAYSPLEEPCTAPTFAKCNLASGKNTYLLGIPPTMIINAEQIKTLGLAPNTEEWKEYKA